MNKSLLRNILLLVFSILFLVSTVSGTSTDYIIPFTGINVSLDSTIYGESQLFGIRINNVYNETISLTYIADTHYVNLATCSFSCTIQLTNVSKDGIIEIRDEQHNLLLRTPLFRNSYFESYKQLIIHSTGEISVYDNKGILSSNKGTYRESLLKNNKYNLIHKEQVLGEKIETILFNLSISDDLEIQSQVTDNYTGKLPLATTEITPIIALEDRLLNYSKAQITLPKKGVEVEYIYHCTNWNFTSRNCSNWETNLTSNYEFSENNTHIIFNVTGFDAFGGGIGNTLANLTSIHVYDVTANVEKKVGGTLINSGLNSTFNLTGLHTYRIEFNITNEGSPWILDPADTIRHGGLNTSWNVTDIWYGIGGTNYSGGNFTSGVVHWNSTFGILTTNNFGTWYYIVNITTNEHTSYTVDWLLNDTSDNSGSIDRSFYDVISQNSSWQIIYGDVFGTIIAGDNSGNNLYEWSQTISSGNIFIVDSDTSINFGNLHAIGRQSNGLVSTNDFLELDVILNITNNYDNLTSRFGLDSNSPRFSRTYTTNEKLVDNVPYINTTNGNFTTGILWDNSTDTTGEFDFVDNETIVFISELNLDQQGLYGVYDYEITIPENLQRTKGESSSLDIYLEIN